MAYATAHAPRNRLPIVVTVAALHVAAGYALITGLAVNFIPEILVPITGKQIDADKPLPPPPPPNDQKTRAEPLNLIFAPTPLVDLNNTRPDILVIDPILLPPLRPALSDGDGLIPLPSPSAAPSFAIKAATPRNKPGLWVTANDYPTSDLRAEREGLTRIALTIDAAGRVSNCAITGSSGFAGLDTAACNRVTERARFNSASDESGAAVAGRYATTVRWEIPD